MVQLVKNPLAMQETWVRSLSCKDPLEKGMATHPLQYSGLENSKDCIAHGVAKSWKRLSPLSLSLNCVREQKADKRGVMSPLFA